MVIVVHHGDLLTPREQFISTGCVRGRTAGTSAPTTNPTCKWKGNDTTVWGQVQVRQLNCTVIAGFVFFPFFPLSLDVFFLIFTLCHIRCSRCFDMTRIKYGQFSLQQDMTVRTPDAVSLDFDLTERKEKHGICTFLTARLSRPIRGCSGPIRSSSSNSMGTWVYMKDRIN